jgi:hypothetical protein
MSVATVIQRVRVVNPIDGTRGERERFAIGSSFQAHAEVGFLPLLIG